MTAGAAILLVGLVAAAALWWGVRARRGQRQARMREIAAALGLTWVAVDDKDLRRRLAVFRLFAPVKAARANAVLTGQVRGRAVTVIDYDYGDFVNSGFNPYLVLVFEADHTLPAFWLHPKGSLNSMGSDGAAVLSSWPGLSGYVLEGESPGPATLACCAGVRGQNRWPSAASQGQIMIYYEPLRQQPSREMAARVLNDGALAYQTFLEWRLDST